jgi:hypothetical protein
LRIKILVFLWILISLFYIGHIVFNIETITILMPYKLL